MPQARREKTDHLIYADVVDSKSKAGVWMGERASFQEKQGRIIEALKEQTDWVELKDAIMVIDTDPAGITVIAPNPALPGVIVLADGGSPAASGKLQAAAEDKVRAVMGELGITEEGNGGLTTMAVPRMLWGKYFQYERDGEAVLLDPVALDSVFIDSGEVHDLAGVPPTATHDALLGLGFTPGGPVTDRREVLRDRLRLFGLDASPRRISGLRVVLTDRCNMACTYCFVDTNTGKPDMTKGELSQGLEFLFEQNAGQDEVSIQWFGGEPTIRFDLMRYGDQLADTLADRYDVARVRRTVVTNGARLTDEALDHFVAYEYGVGISIDGPPGINSAHRLLLGGQPADDRIRRNVARFVEAEGLHVGCNLTPTAANIGRLAQTVRWIIDDLGLKFIYVNTPIPTAGHWQVNGADLARELYEARLAALGRGGMLFSVLDRAFQALDTRRPMLFDHMQGDRSLNAALLPGNRVSLCDINFTEPSFLHTLDELRADPGLLAGVAKKVAPIPECGNCPALAICGGPSRNEQALIGGSTPDPEMCAFYTSTVEIAVWDNTGVQ